MIKLRIRLHPFFLTTLVISLWFGYISEWLIAFVVVILHEIGHYVAARLVGWEIIELHLLPFGGELVAQQNKLSTSREECFVACAGPFVNLLLILGAYILNFVGILPDSVCLYFVKVNAWLACFNLIPVLPLDGGKILLALIASRASYHSAQHIVIHSSILIGFIMMVYSISQLTFTGIRFDLFMVSVFIIYVNIASLRWMPLFMTRYFLQKLRWYDALSQEEVDGLLAKSKHVTLSQQVNAEKALQQTVRGKMNHFFLINHEKKVVAAVSERELLCHFFSRE